MAYSLYLFLDPTLVTFQSILVSVSAYPKRLSEAVSNPVAVCPSTPVSAITRVSVLCPLHTAPLSGLPQQHAVLICPHLWSRCLICLVDPSSPTPVPCSPYTFDFDSSLNPRRDFSFGSQPTYPNVYWTLYGEVLQ